MRMRKKFCYRDTVRIVINSRIADSTLLADRIEEMTATPNAPARRTSLIRDAVMPPMAKTGMAHRRLASSSGRRPMGAP
jgi:hypothetical protein